MCDALCDDCLPRSFYYFSFYTHFDNFSFFFIFLKFSFQPQIVLNLFFFFSGDLSLTVLIKCVLNKKKSVLGGREMVKSKKTQ